MDFFAFLSYKSTDNRTERYSDGVLTVFREMLEEEVRQATGEPNFTIFQDKEHIGPGKPWLKFIEEKLEQAVMLIIIITPGYFRSSMCRKELDLFLRREKELGRNDLILPIYWYRADEIEAHKENENEVAQILLQRQFADFREVVVQGFHSSEGTKAFQNLALQIKRIKEIYHEDEESPEKVPDPPPDQEFRTTEGFIYAERMGHFKEEKPFLCRQLSEFLLLRMKRFADRDGYERIVLFVDSGTTLFPMIQILGSFAKEHGDGFKNHWIHKVIMITNNTTGIRWLMKHGRFNNNSRFSELAINCLSVPGKPLATYSAFTGFGYEWNASLRKAFRFLQSDWALRCLIGELRKENVKVKVISLVTGSWVRIRDTSPRVPLPLARFEGHLDIKQAMVDIADEVYILAPLGKIFAGWKREDIHAVLAKFVDTAAAPRNYKEIKFELPKLSAATIKLVTTARPSGYLLSNLSSLLEKEGYLDALRVKKKKHNEYNDYRHQFSVADFEHVSNLMFEFSDLPKDRRQQFEAEFPHESSRKIRDFISRFHLEDTDLDMLFSS